MLHNNNSLKINPAIKPKIRIAAVAGSPDKSKREFV